MRIAPAMSFHRRVAPRGMLANIVTIARRELRDALRGRSFWLYTLAFIVLGLGVSHVSAVTSGGAGLAGFGRTSAGLINLVMLVVPLMSLSAGASTIASDRERGMLPYLLAMPVTRTEVLLGKYVALAISVACSIALGFGVCAATLAMTVSSTRADSLLHLVLLSMLLALPMLAIGMCISVFARRTSVAVGTAVFVWLGLAFASDLGLMAGTLTFKLSIQTLFGISLANPLQVFKMWSLEGFDATLDVLGPAGLYGQETLGSIRSTLFAAILLAWTIVPLALSAVVFSRRSPV
ncbi:MAG: ABC transporter permease subunit [Tepidisphaeraceae bacterium]